MKLTNVFEADDRGVSPVIGVILMVAITVILAAVIGTFVLGLGNQVGNNAPQATFNYEYGGFSDGASGQEYIAITHQSGQSIEASNIDVTVGPNMVYEDGAANTSSPLGTPPSTWSGTINAGSTLNVTDGSTSSSAIFRNDQKVSVIWESESGSSSIISTSTTPN